MELININNNSLLFQSKEEVKEIAFTIFDQVESGEQDPLKTLAVIHKIGLICKEVETNLRPLALKAIGTEKLSKFGITLSQVKTGSTFDYIGTGDQEYLKLIEQLDQLKAKIKSREMMLRSLNSQLEFVNTDTGETYTIHPPVNTYSESLKIDF